MGEPKAHALYGRLRDDFVAGAYVPGDRLSENQVAERYGVSRTPVREALARLEYEGLLVRAGSVVTVAAPSVDQVLDLFDARTKLESEIARCAAQRRREGDLVLLRTASEHCRQLTSTSDATDLYHANREFHHALGRAAHNLVLPDLQRMLDLRVAALRATTLTAAGRWATATAQHDQMLTAVEAGDADAAGAATERHMHDARELWLQRLNRTTN